MINIILSLTLLTSPDWVKIAETDDAVAYTKDTGTSVVAFKGSTIIEAPADVVMKVLMDNENKYRWVDRLAVSEVVKEHSPTKLDVYQHFNLPWPISDRDYFYRAELIKYPNGDQYLRLSSLPSDHIPSVGVRAELVESSYRLMPIEGNKTFIEVEIFTDPKGYIPTWLVKIIQKKWPIQTLKGIREEVKRVTTND